jgi:hypothetical protein
MSARKELEKRIAKEQTKLEGLRLEVGKLEQFILGLREALRFLPRSPENDQPDTKLRPGSDVANIRKVLLDAREPLHVRELLIGLGRDDTKERRSSIAGSLGSYARNSQIFVRTGPNTFGLLELLNHYEERNSVTEKNRDKKDVDEETWQMDDPFAAN